MECCVYTNCTALQGAVWKFEQQLFIKMHEPTVALLRRNILNSHWWNTAQENRHFYVDLREAFEVFFESFH